VDTDLRDQLVRAMLRVKKLGMTFPPDVDIRLGELHVLRGIAESASCPGRSVCVSDIQGSLCMTMPAVSQLLSSLEKKGYVAREIDRGDRRRVAVSLTQPGREILTRTSAYTNRIYARTIDRFGEENTRQLIALLDHLADILDGMKRESRKPEQNGEDDKLDETC